MTLAEGSRIGPYTVLAPLGAGGMGEVYRARDPRLERDVAIKALPAAFARDPERVARFEREARLLASLKHPNIGGILGLEEAGGERYLVLEYVEGETLAARLVRGALPLDEALEVCRQVAAALEAAHEGGVVHRDLKPGNVMLTPSGEVKVLDFGLAKAGAATSGSSSDPGLSASPTMTYAVGGGSAGAATGAGVILGTAAYMSPEQARGKAVDRRADIWSFGCVLYECLSGRRAYEGETVSDLVARILEREPDWSALPGKVPGRVEELLRRCLTKDPRERLRDIGEARITLAAPNAGVLPAAPATAAPLRARAGWLGWVVGASGIVVAVLAWSLAGRRPETPVMRAVVPQPPGASFLFFGDNAGPPVISPDGGHVAFVAVDQTAGARLWVRDIGALAARPIPGTENATYPFWSPDSRSIGFFADFKLKRVDLATGQVLALCAAPAGRGGTWGRDGRIVFGPDFQTDLMWVPATGGTPARIPGRDPQRFTTHRWPEFLPDGKHFLFYAGNHRDPAGSENAVWVGSLDGRGAHELIRSVSQAEYAGGHLFYVQDSVLMARPFDADRMRFTGEAMPTAERVQFDATTWKANFSVSGVGVLAYQQLGGRQGVQIQMLDRAGHRVEDVGESGNHFSLSLSPDGHEVAYTSQVQPNGDIYLHDFARDQDRRVSPTDNDDDMPVLSPDGRLVAYTGRESDFKRYRVVVMPLDAAGGERVLYRHPTRDAVPFDWSSDGRWLLVGVGDWIATTTDSLFIVPVDGLSPPRLVAVPGGLITFARFSHDGRWVATSTMSGTQSEVDLVSTTAEPGAGARRVQVTTRGGQLPCWRGDDRELYYVRPDAMVVAVTLEPGSMRPGPEVPLFRAVLRPYIRGLDVSRDGQRFVVNTLAGEGAAPIVLVSDWKRDLARR